MKLLGTRLIVCPIAAKLISIGGIHLLEGSVDSKQLWRVLEVGMGVTEIRKGDCVVTADAYGQCLADLHDGSKVIDQKECVAVVTDYR